MSSPTQLASVEPRQPSTISAQTSLPLTAAVAVRASPARKGPVHERGAQKKRCTTAGRPVLRGSKFGRFVEHLCPMAWGCRTAICEGVARGACVMSAAKSCASRRVPGLGHGRCQVLDALTPRAREAVRLSECTRGAHGRRHARSSLRV